ncbi:MAG: hypothetical protein ABIP39_14370 [Polyangiaceae bacterium]
MMYGWSWWWIWMMFIFVLMVPTGYGWGYRGWGPPYPAYHRRKLAATKGPDHPSAQWGWVADALWIFLCVDLFLLVVGGLWWR